MKETDHKLNRRAIESGGAAWSLHLILLLLMTVIIRPVWSQSTNLGGINFYDDYLNKFFYLDSEGIITLGGDFSEGMFALLINPDGNLMVGSDIDFLTTRSAKLYRISEGGFEMADVQLPIDTQFSPRIWTPTQNRGLFGSGPLRIWQTDPFSMTASLLSEFHNDKIWAFDAVIAPEIDYLYLINTGDDEIFSRIAYDSYSGKLSDQVEYLPTPQIIGLINVTSNKRTIIGIVSAGRLSIYKILDDGQTTMTLNMDLYLSIGMRNPRIGALSPNDKYYFLGANDELNVASFELTTSGTLNFISGWTGFRYTQTMAVTPDGKYLVFTHHHCACQPAAILSIFRIEEDGVLTHLPDNDVPLSRTPQNLFFFPPPQPIPRPASWRLD